MNEQPSSHTPYNQSGQTVLGNQINVAGNVGDTRAIYAGLTAQALQAACQTQVQSVIDTVRSKYNPDLYVHRAIETELNAFFDQPLADPRRNCYLIVAPAGSGKTNLLCDLAKTRAAEQPVLLLLGGSTYLSGRAGLLGALQSELEAANAAISFQTEADSLHALHHLTSVLNHDALILLDAINEHDKPAEMRKAVAELLRHTRNHRIKLVITCRDFYWNLFKGPFWDEAIVNSLPTDGANEKQEVDQEADQDDFYRFAAAEQHQALTLYLHHYAIAGRPVGAALDQCRHPLLLRFFCEAYRGQNIGEIEDIRLKELFDRYWDQKLLSIAERRLQQGEERLQAGLIDEVASYLLNVAGYMLHHNERSILLTKLPEAANVTELTTDPRSLYGRIRDEFIILEEQEHGKSKRKVRQIAFVYEEFMEYVMARALLQGWDDQGLDNDAILHELDKLKDNYQHFSQILGVMVYLAIMLKESPRELALWSFLINSGTAWRGVVFEAFKKLPKDQLDAGVYAALLDLLQSDASVQVQILDLLKIERIGDSIALHEGLFTTICALAVHRDERLARRATLALQYTTDVRAIHACIRNLGHRSKEVRKNTAQSLLRIGECTLEPLIVALKDQDAQVRLGVAVALTQLGDARAVEPLIAALNDQDVEMRRATVSALTQLGDARAVEPLIAALNDQDVEVRLGVAVALTQLGDARAVEPLIAALNDQDVEMRRATVSALTQLGDARAVEPLIAALNDQDVEVRLGVAVALTQLGDARAVEPLIAALNDQDAQVRRVAVSALTQLGDARAVEPLIAALKDQDAQVRRFAVSALTQLGDARAVEPLIAALKDQDAQVRRAAASSLTQLGPHAVEPLMAALKDEDAHVRQVAVSALRKLGDARAVEPFIAALKDKDAYVRREAVSALGRLGDERAVEPLMAALKDQVEEVRRAAISTLEQMGDKRAVEPLMAALKDQDIQVRRATAATLEQLGDERAVEPLMAALKDEDIQVRRAAVSALRQLGDERAVEPLMATLKDEDVQVRRAAVSTLRHLDDARAIESLMAALIKDQDAQVRQVAAAALRQLGDTRAVEPLMAALKDQDAQVRQTAAVALGQLGDARAVEPLMAVLKDQDAQVRQRAAAALRRLGGTRALEPLIAAHDHKLVEDELFARALARFQPQDLHIFASRLNDADATVRQSTQQVLDRVEQIRVELAARSRVSM